MTEEEIIVKREQLGTPYLKEMKEAQVCLNCARNAIVKANHTEDRPGTAQLLGAAIAHLDGASKAACEAMHVTVTNTERFLCKVLISQISNVRDLINDRTLAL